MNCRTATAITAAALAFAAGCGLGEPATGEAAVEHVSPAPLGNDATSGAVTEREARPIEQAARARSLPEALQSAGRITINENRTWHIGAVTDGRIVEVLAHQGDPVEQGQILARMYGHEIHDVRAEHRKAAAELDRLKAALTYARSIRNRTQRLYELKAASLQQVEQAEAELRNAETAVASGEVELERTRGHLEEFLKVPAEVLRDPKRGARGGDGDLIAIRSPASGTLLHRNVTVGTVVGPCAEMFVVADLSTLWVIAAIGEQHLSKLRVGMPVRVFVPAYRDRPFPGKLANLGERLDPATHTLVARIDVPNQGRLLRPEMRATVELELGGSRMADFVPEIALPEVQGRSVRTVRQTSGGPCATETAPEQQKALLRSQLPKTTLAEQ